MGKLLLREHDSLRDTLDFVQTHEFSKMTRQSTAPRQPSFNATNSLEECMTLARHGWHEHTEGVDDLRRATLQTASVARIIEDNVRVVVPDVVGGSVDVGRYLTGNPKAMRNRKRQMAERLRRVVDVVVIASVDCGTRPETIVHQGSQLVALVDVLTVCGFAVKVRLSMGIQGWSSESDAIEEVVCVKDSHESLDLASLMFTVAHPDMFRRIGFALFESQPDSVRNKFSIQRGGSYSSPKRGTDVDGQDLTIMLGSAFERTDTDAEWIRRQVDRIVESAGGTVMRDKAEV